MKKHNPIKKVAKYHNYKGNKVETRKPWQGTTKRYEEACRIRSTYQWQKVRKIVMTKFHGLCGYCLKRPADTVHHIQALTQRPDLAFHDDNLCPICDICHKRMEVREKRGEDAAGQLKERMNKNLEKLKDGK